MLEKNDELETDLFIYTHILISFSVLVEVLSFLLFIIFKLPSLNNDF